MSERVVIKIDIDADTSSIERVRAQLVALKAEASALDDEFGGLRKSTNLSNRELDGMDSSANRTSRSLNKAGNSSNNFANKTQKLGKQLNTTNSRFGGFNKMIGGFGKALQGIVKFSLKAVLVNVAALSIALLTVSGAFTVARLAAKAWQATLTVGAVAGASMISALAALAAGQREYNAALQAYNYKGPSSLGAGTQEAMAQMRGLTKDVSLAVLGAEALGQAFAAISKSTPMTGGLQSAMRAMGDFAASSADPSKSIVAAGDFIGQLVKGGKLTDELMLLAADVGPTFAAALEKGVKDMDIKTSDQFVSALTSGQLSTQVSGQLQAINDTLFGTVKRNFTLIKEQFADMGQGSLPAFTGAFQEIANILSTRLMSVSGAINHFTQGTMLDAIVSGFEKAAMWASKLFNEYLPKSEGMIGRIREQIDGFQDGFRKAVDWMRPLLDGVRVLKDAFGPLVKSLFVEFGGGMQSFAQLLEDNKEDFMAFGETLKNVFAQISNITGGLKTVFVRILPILSTFGKTLEVILATISTILGKAGGSSFGSLAAVIAGGIGFSALGRAGQRAGGTGKGGVLSRAGQAMGISNGGMSQSVAHMSVGTMTVGAMTQGGGAAGKAAAGAFGATGGQIGPALPLSRMDKAKSWAKSSQGVALAGMLAGGWGVGKVTQNESATGNILGGTAAGAGIGTMIAPGVGTLIGAGVGAIGGGAYDMFYGEGQRNKASARRAAGDVTGTAADSVSNSIAGYDFNEAKNTLAALTKRNDQLRAFYEEGTLKDSSKSERESALLGTSYTTRSGKVVAGGVEFQRLVAGMHFSDSEIKGFIEAPGNYVSELEKGERDLRLQVNPAIVSFNENIKALGNATGMTEGQIIGLGRKMGVDFTTEIEDFTGILEQALGIEIPESLKEFEAASSNMFLNAVDKITLPSIKLQEAGMAVDQSMKVMGEGARTGVMPTEAEINAMIRDATSYELQKTYNPLSGETNPDAALAAMFAKVGTGGLGYQPGAEFAGLESSLAPAFQKALQAISDDFKIQKGRMAEGALGANAGTSPILDGPLTNAQILAMSPVDLAALTDAAAASYALKDAITGMPGLTRAAIAGALSNINVKVSVASDGMVTSGRANQPPPGGGSGPKPGDVGWEKGDTSTSRFASTMAKHGALSGRLAGKRQVTSGMRSDNLGSLDSDHLNGAAYDLTGQNLGSYQQLVRGSGGFAEFHGGLEDRHLHVVPGEGSVGDTPMPMGQLTSAPEAAASGDSVSFTINPSPGMNEEALANMVIKKYLKEVRSAKERR